MPRYFENRLGFAVAAAVVILSAAPAFAIPALAQCMMGCGSNAMMSRPAPTLDIDVPASNTVVRNGAMVDIGGWTPGSRVDVYLDGPAGFGAGIGSADVDQARPDVVQATGNAALEDSGFDVAWAPIDLTAGAHTLYVYSLVGDTWTWQTRPVVGEGNEILDLGRERDGEARTSDLETTDNGVDGTATP